MEATPAYRTEEVNSAKTMVDRVEQRFRLTPRRLVGDTAYGTAPMLAWMVEEKAIEPHVPVWERYERKDGTFANSDFEWDEQANEYHCPEGKSLRSQWRPFKKERTHITKDDRIIYLASQRDCAGCSLKQRCCPHTPVRKNARSIHESARDVARAIAGTDPYKQSRKERKKVEILFAHLKRILKLDRLRLRGLLGAQDEFLMAATAQNLRRLARQFLVSSEESSMTATWSGSQALSIATFSKKMALAKSAKWPSSTAQKRVFQQNRPKADGHDKYPMPKQFLRIVDAPVRNRSEEGFRLL